LRISRDSGWPCRRRISSTPRRWRTEPNHRRHGVPCWRRRLRDLLPLIALSQSIQHRRRPRPGAAYVGGFFTYTRRVLYTFEDSASPNRRRHFSSFFLAYSFRISCIASISCTLATARVLSLVPRRVHVHDACRFHLHPFRFIFQSPETSIKYVGSWGDPRPRRCCHRQPSGGLHRT